MLKITQTHRDIYYITEEINNEYLEVKSKIHEVNAKIECLIETSKILKDYEKNLIYQLEFFKEIKEINQ